MDLMKDREELCNTGPDEETVMREKKRLRRVSFAENTEVHVFDRDDEDCSSETPPQPPPSPLTSHQYPKLGLLAQSNDSGDDEDDNGRFLRDLDSSSPGSAPSSATSANSNDEENFFGPVSASFIRLGQQSDSAASQEHDITLDSTAFSMHFQSLVPSESATGNCKTPKTPSFEGKFSVPTNSGSFMAMTHVKKHIDYTPLSAGDSGDSNDMCMIKSAKSDKFDYGRLSPTLEALLAQCKEEMHPGSVADQRSVSKPSNHHSSESEIEELQVVKGGEVFNIDRGDTPCDMVYGEHNQSLEANNGAEITPISKGSRECIFSRVDSLVSEASTSHQNQTLVELIQERDKHLENINQQDQYVNLAHAGQDQGLAGTSAIDVNTLGSNANGRTTLRILRSLDNKDTLNRTSQRDSGNFGSFLTPLRKGTTLNSPLGSADLNFITRTAPVKTVEKFSERNHLHKSASPRVRRTATAIRLEKRLEETGVQDGVRKETQALSESENLRHFRRRGPLLYTNISNSVGHDQSDPQSQPTQERFSVHDVDNSGRKRRIEDIEPRDKNSSIEIGSENPNVIIESGASVFEFQLEYFPKGNDQVEKSAGYESQGHWVNVLKGLPGAMERLLSPSIEKLNTRELHMLEDMVRRMQTAATYEKLSALVQFQRVPDILANNHQIRMTEAKWLQETFTLEQAKSLLLRMKQDQLRTKVQLLESRIQEARKLKFSMKNILGNSVKDAQNRAINLQSHSVDLSNGNVDTCNKVIAKQKELESLDIKVQKLTKSLLASCKIKGDPHPDECIVLLNDYLTRKARCRLIQKDLQLCEVDGLERENGRLNLILSYFDVLHQSFIMSGGSFPKLVTVTKLENANIMKSFSNMNACTAFAFVFDETARDLVSSKNLAVETQITRSLVHSLLIVIGEVQVACMELRNLIQTSFCSPHAGRLELELCFMDFKTGNKVMLTLDMTCLNRGGYPLEIHPQVSMAQTSEALSTEIGAAIRSVEAGYSMIYRLCKCVSKVILT